MVLNLVCDLQINRHISQCSKIDHFKKQILGTSAGKNECGIDKATHV